MDVNARFDFFGIHITITNPEDTANFLINYNYNATGYISFPDGSVVAMAQNDGALKDILNKALLTLPDGKPSEFFARLKGFRNVSTVSGYWLCKRLFNTDLKHYFLGSTNEKLKKIIGSVKLDFPAANIVGYQAPPFHDITYFKNGNILDMAINEINKLKPDLIWVGLSSPKQDFLMHTHARKLEYGIMLGVGGVFDYLSGDIKKSPEWIKKIGLRWLWRLAKEPRRLGPKYVLTLRIFLKLIIRTIFNR